MTKPVVALALTIACVVSPAAAWAADVPTITVVAVDAQASEAGADTATFLVTREAARIDAPLVVPFVLSGSAMPGADYASPGLAVTFAAQVPMVMVTIRPLPDALTERNETVLLTLAEKQGAYGLGDDRKAQITIADAPPNSHAPSKPGQSAPPDSMVDPPPNPLVNLPPPDRVGALFVSITLEGAGSWKHPQNGEYANHKFHRVLTYTVPLRGVYGGGSGFTQIDRRESPQGFALPNFKRYLMLQPRDALAAAGTPCGKGTTDFLDERSGLEVGDPGQPPLVPYTHTVKGGGTFPSGDKTVTERDLCQTAIAFDYDKHVYHLRLDGSDSYVKTQINHNGFLPPPVALPLTGYDNGEAKGKLTFFDLPLAANATGVEGSKVFENFSVVSGTHDSKFPLRATVKWRITTQPGPNAQ